MKRTILVICGLIFLSSLSIQATEKVEDAILGRWLTEGGKSQVQIVKNEVTGEYEGSIVWLKEPLGDDGAPARDDKNQDPRLRSRPIMGLAIISGFVYDEKERWVDGKIYNPDDGKTYSCYLQLLDQDRLKVRGFIGVSLLGKTQVWERVLSAE